MTNVKTLLIALVVLTTSCFRGDYDYADEPPYNPPYGDYIYESQSVYFDANQNEVDQRDAGGAIYIDLNSGTSTSMTITPLRGWGYNLDISSLTPHALGNNKYAYSFNIVLQSVYSNNKEFNVQGLRSQELRNPVDSTLIGTFDGVIDAEGIMKFDFVSLDFITDETTRTSITTLP